MTDEDLIRTCLFYSTELNIDTKKFSALLHKVLQGEILDAFSRFIVKKVMHEMHDMLIDRYDREKMISILSDTEASLFLCALYEEHTYSETLSRSERVRNIPRVST